MSRKTPQLNCLHMSLPAILLLATSALAQYSNTDRGCIACHESAGSKSDFCNDLPATIWRQDDKHRRAFELLHESNSPDAAARAKKQALVRQILGFDLREVFRDNDYSELIEPTSDEAKSRITTVKACLQCHGTWPKDAGEQYMSYPPVALELGVSCQACHGPGQRWADVHTYESWRRVTPQAKAALGFADCRSPLAKAKLCASCHVGSIADEKFVKHEWYAAGHPPLPSFELASFEAQMPRHWKSLREKGPFKFRESPSTGAEPIRTNQRLALHQAGVPDHAIADSYLQANFANALSKGLQPGNDLAALKDAIIGGAVAFSAYTRSLGDYAAQAADKRANWPELALYDCSACHHELRSGLGTNTRPKRNHMPGRPPLTTWPEVLTRLAAAQAEANQPAGATSHWAQINALMAKVDTAATNRPFGEPSAISAAAHDLAAALDQLAADALNTNFNDQAARSAIQFLGDVQNYQAADFYTARQVGWALTATANDLKPSSGAVLFAQQADDPLALRLPSGPNQSVIDNLRRWLPAAGKYDPTWFQEQLKAIPRH